MDAEEVNPDQFVYEDDELPEGFVYDEEPETPDEAQTPEQETESYLQRLSKHYSRAGEELTEFKKAIKSGSSFGFSQNDFGVPELAELNKPSENPELRPFFKGGEMLGETLNVSKLMGVGSAGALKLASKSPYLRKQLTSVASILGVGAAGITNEVARELAKGELPSAEDVVSSGIIWSALDAGLIGLGTLGRFTAGLFNLARTEGGNAYQALKGIVNDLRASGVKPDTPDAVAASALEILEQKLQQAPGPIENVRPVEKLTPEKALGAEVGREAIPKPVAPVKNRELKVTNESVSKLENQSVDLAKPFQAEKINLGKESEELANRGHQAAMDLISPRAATEKELGHAIQKDVETTLKAAKKEYKPFYTEAESAAAVMNTNPANTAQTAGDALIAIERIKTKPPGYASVDKTIETALNDAGYVVQRNEQGAIEMIIGENEVSVAQLMDLGRRLNEIADFETIGPSIKDHIKNIVKAVKKDIRVGLKGNPDALTAFELAEEEYAKVAARYGRESVHGIRGEQAGEKITKALDQPTVLADLKQTVSPKQYLEIEREVLEKLNKLPYEKAKVKLRELKPHLSEESQNLAKSIVEGKNPANSSAQKLATQQGVLQELADSFASGSRPSKTLDLWKTTKGQKLITEALENSPNRARVTKYLNEQSFNDVVSSVSNSAGHIDPTKLGRMMENAAVLENIRMIGGDEAVTFFKGMESKLEMIQSKAKLANGMPTNEQILTQVERTQARINDLAKEKLKIKEGVTHGKKTPAELEHEAAQIQRGNTILKRMAAEDYPVNAKIKDWERYFKENLGLSGEKSMTIFGLLKLGLAKGTSTVIGAQGGGIPAALASTLGYKYMRRLAVSKKARHQFNKAAEKTHDPFAFIQSMRLLGTNLEE